MSTLVTAFTSASERAISFVVFVAIYSKASAFLVGLTASTDRAGRDVVMDDNWKEELCDE